MSKSIAISIANALAARLKSDSIIPENREAAARLKPRKEAEVTDFFVDVVPMAQTREIETRSAPDPTQTILVAIGNKVGWDRNAKDFIEEDVDSVVQVAESIASHFTQPGRSLDFAAGSVAMAVRCRIGDEAGMIVDADLLENSSIALAFVELQFRVVKTA